MRFGWRTVARAGIAVVLVGSAASMALAPTAAAAAGFRGGGGGFHGGGGGFHGGGYGGFHGGGYGGYRGGYGGYGGFRGGYGYRGYGGFGYGGFGYGGFGFGGCCYGGYYGGFGFGDALLGAAVIGGTAAIIASNDEPYYDGYPPAYPVYAPPVAVAPPGDYGYGAPPPPPPPQGQPQAYQSTDPVEQCTRAAVGEAASRGDTGRVTKIDRVDGYQNGAHVTGTLEVHRASRNGAVENAHFTCTADYGQVTAFRFG